MQFNSSNKGYSIYLVYIIANAGYSLSSDTSKNREIWVFDLLAF